MTSKPDADARLVEAHDLALAALHEITPAATVGPAAGFTPEEDGSVSLRFENRLPGYPGWYWTVTVARVEDEEPTVLEVELLPGDGALLAPEWVPWAERLAEYRAHQAELAEAAAAGGEHADGEEEDADGDLDDDGIDDDELDEDGSDILHAGDLDGVDIDELDPSDQDDELDASDEDDEDDEAEDSEDDDADARDADAGDEEE
ncbi:MULTISPECIES: DUF3027 domain-containing protein [unclassified Microbacterium]|uniref:DUF3027 domain-containing protein n=1 Tax=unclassified Microbacterium TaxID=2609290 RepID=UPI002468AA2C|nr:MULTISPECIES: DUF3027 domain-containing protein [unclassified Microbacterium]MDH5133063.1 DUF3027 domain-containing protein [Microbacterium sp. RD10]MDH5136578.1 DUF3027 domain-containing protein [Microbacterium sp. RD11]MDH5144588.1 DUF3027 domain-containing protein [Microbacterium sp. RD12]MDH5154603.1 DUF3027 domain-containing protein [Microbacterium sp. RD06]MDH5165119.1 DUF3027 domain-containing protein [Microbacterium sp. RD02]